jgi:hypothetical protein
MRAQATRPRRIWPWILVALLVVSAIIAALTVTVWNRQDAQPSANPTPTATMSTTPDAEPTGCLGGTTRDAAMVLAAQEAAPHTSNGAVEFATAFVRWIQRFPYPTSDEARQLQPVLAEESFTDDLADYISSEPDLSGGIVEAGTDYYMNTVPGVWNLESVADDDVTVSIGSGFVIEGELSSTLRSSITITTHWDGSRWTIADADGTRTPEELYRIGTPFTEGC